MISASEYAAQLRNELGRHGVQTLETVHGGFDVPRRIAHGSWRVVTGSVRIGREDGNIHIDLFVRPVGFRAGDGHRQVMRRPLESFHYFGKASDAPLPDKIGDKLGLYSLNSPLVLEGGLFEKGKPSYWSF